MELNPPGQILDADDAFLLLFIIDYLLSFTLFHCSLKRIMYIQLTWSWIWILWSHVSLDQRGAGDLIIVHMR